MLEFSSLGAKVLHPRAVEFAKRYGVKIHVRSSSLPEEGTWIHEENPDMERPEVCGLTYLNDEAKISILDVPDKPGMAALIFSVLAEADINVDVIVLNQTRKGITDISFTVPRSDCQKSREILVKLGAAEGFGEVLADPKMAKISIVGSGMRSHPGVAAKMFKALARAKVNINLISTSEIKVSCVISETDLDKAMNEVFHEFGLDTISPTKN